MQYKLIRIDEQDTGAIVAALRIHIVYLQQYRRDAENKGENTAERALMRDICSCTMIADKIQYDNPWMIS